MLTLYCYKATAKHGSLLLLLLLLLPLLTPLLKKDIRAHVSSISFPLSRKPRRSYLNLGISSCWWPFDRALIGHGRGVHDTRVWLGLVVVLLIAILALYEVVMEY